MGLVRVLIQPPYVGDRSDQIASQAFSILSEVASISFVGAGGRVNNRVFVLVDSADVTEALAVLGKAGMRGVVD